MCSIGFSIHAHKAFYFSAISSTFNLATIVPALYSSGFIWCIRVHISIMWSCMIFDIATYNERRHSTYRISLHPSTISCCSLWAYNPLFVPLTIFHLFLDSPNTHWLSACCLRPPWRYNKSSSIGIEGANTVFSSPRTTQSERCDLQPNHHPILPRKANKSDQLWCNW